MTTSTVVRLNTLWARVAADPNNVELLSEWIRENEKASGRSGVRAAFQRASTLPDSWLAKIWATALLLEDGKLEESMALYEQALTLAPRKSLAVQEISDHLGGSGYHAELIDLLLPIYSPDDHGPYAGFNLVNACEDCDDLDAADEVLRRMSTAQWKDESRPQDLQRIVHIRQEKFALLRELRDEKFEDAGANE